MTDESCTREATARAQAAEALRYKRSTAAQRPVIDTSRLWAPVAPPPPPAPPTETSRR